jgi:hypothetical protein
MQQIAPLNKNLILIFYSISFFFCVSHLGYAQVGIATTTPLSTFEVNGSFGQTITTVTSDLTLDATHSIIVCNNGAVTKTITLPNAVGVKGRIYSIKRDENSTQNIIIATVAGQFIDGEINFLLTQAKETITLISDGNNWKVIGRFAQQISVGELSYFNTTGTIITLNSSTTDGSSNLFFCNPATTISANSVDFSSSENGKLKYIGKIRQSFRIAASITATSNASGSYIYQFKKTNGNFLPASRVIEKLTNSDVKTTSLQSLITLDPNDSIELWVGKIGETGSVSIKSFNIVASGL